VGAFLFLPAASSASFPLFLGALVVLAAGITGLQVAANPYVVVLGEAETASSRLDLTQAFNSLGTTIAPKLGGLLILSAAPLAIEELQSLSPQALHLYRVQQAASVKMPYVVIGVALVLLAVLIATSKLPKIETAAYRPGEKVNDSVWRHPNLIFGAIGIFAYVGAEVSIGSFLVNYFGQPDIAGFSAKTAAGYVSIYWGSAMAGRFLGAPLLRRIKTGRLLALCAVCSAALVVISMLTTGHVAMWSILAVGLFNSIMFPSIFSLGEAELGRITGSGSGNLTCARVAVSPSTVVMRKPFRVPLSRISPVTNPPASSSNSRVIASATVVFPIPGLPVSRKFFMFGGMPSSPNAVDSYSARTPRAVPSEI
jgi:FHS family L-fucose permease-like MFS transporter